MERAHKILLVPSLFAANARSAVGTSIYHAAKLARSIPRDENRYPADPCREDFFNASGMATPDDLTEFNNCQMGFAAGEGRMNDMSRGSTRWEEGPGKFGKVLNVDAVLSSPAVADEGLYVAIHNEWIDRMNVAIDEECAELVALGEMETAQ